MRVSCQAARDLESKTRYQC